jgi:hypothetical protein
VGGVLDAGGSIAIGVSRDHGANALRRSAADARGAAPAYGSSNQNVLPFPTTTTGEARSQLS